MEVVKTVNAASKDGNQIANAKANFLRDSQRVSVKNILTNHFRKNK